MDVLIGKLASIDGTLVGHTDILLEHPTILKEHSTILKEHSKQLALHDDRLAGIERTLEEMKTDLLERAFHYGDWVVLESSGGKTRTGILRDELTHPIS
ncbi:MAG: hypothetical protein C4326_07355 [Ignavibacteria bacterium]